MKIEKIKNQIIRGMLTPLKKEKVDAVAFHHMANPTWDIFDVEKYHVLNNGWMAIGYNYWIGFDGTVWEGRGFNVGAGIAGHNSHVISVGLQGDFMSGSPTKEQYKACAELYTYLKKEIPTINKYARHSDYNATLCPGVNFNINKIEEYLKENEMKTYNEINDCPAWSQPYVKKAVELGLVKGVGDGKLNLTDEKIWTLTVIVRTYELMKGEK